MCECGLGGGGMDKWQNKSKFQILLELPFDISECPGHAMSLPSGWMSPELILEIVLAL